MYILRRVAKFLGEHVTSILIGQTHLQKVNKARQIFVIFFCRAVLEDKNLEKKLHYTCMIEKKC